MMEVVAECFMVAFAQAVSSREMEEETLNEAYYQSLLDDHQEPEVTVAEPPAIPYMWEWIFPSYKANQVKILSFYTLLVESQQERKKRRNNWCWRWPLVVQRCKSNS